MTTKEDFVLIAQLAQEARRYEDMKSAMKRFVETSSNKELSNEERYLLIIGYKQIIAQYRKSIRILKQTRSRKSYFDQLVDNYLQQIETELKLVINEFIELLDKYLIPSAQKHLEVKCLYLKLKSDFLRYLLDLNTINDYQKQNRGR